MKSYQQNYLPRRPVPDSFEEHGDSKDDEHGHRGWPGEQRRGVCVALVSLARTGVELDVLDYVPGRDVIFAAVFLEVE